MNGGERERVVEGFKRLGLAGYEAKAYTALIGAGEPLTGYEIAKRSRVPRSTVYETLGKLVSRGAVFEVTVNGSAAYLPLPPERLLDGMRRDFEGATEWLRTSLPSVLNPPTTRIIHHLKGRNAVVERALQLIEGSRRSLYVVAWFRDAEELRPALRAAEKRGVAVFFLAFGDEESVEGVFPHRLRTAPGGEEPVAHRLLSVAADLREVIVGSVAEDDMSAVYSDDPAVTLVTTEYIRHDIALQRLAERIGLERTIEIWKTDEALVRLAQMPAPGVGPEME